MLVNVVVDADVWHVVHVQMLTNSSLQGFLTMSHARFPVVHFVGGIEQGLRIKLLLSHRVHGVHGGLERSEWRRRSNLYS